MNRPPEIEQIEARLGRIFTMLEAIGPYSAFRAAIDVPRVVFTPDGSEFPLDRLVETVGEHCLSCHGLGYTVLVGLPDDVGPPWLYAIADADPIVLMTAFDVALAHLGEGGDIDVLDALGRMIHTRQRLELWWD